MNNAAAPTRLPADGSDTCAHIVSLYRMFVFCTGTAWLVTFREGHDHELFKVNTEGMGGTSPFAVVEEVRPYLC